MVYEELKILHDSIIRYGYRDIVSTEFRGNELHIFAKNSYYKLDTNLSITKNGWWGIETKSLPYTRYQIKYGDHYGLMFNKYDGITVFDLDQAYSDQINFKMSKTYIQEGITGWCYSEVDETNRFSVLTASREGDSAVWRLHNYLIDHNPGAFQPIKLIKEDNIILIAFDSNVPLNAAFSLTRIGGKILAHVDGVLHTFKGSVLESTSRYWINSAIEVDGDFYALNNGVRYISDNHQTYDGLIISRDRGITWNYYENKSLQVNSSFKEIGGKKIVFQSWFIGLLEDETDKVKQLDLEGLDAAIYTLEKIGNKVVVGTDAGVYYKSWESFF